MGGHTLRPTCSVWVFSHSQARQNDTARNPPPAACTSVADGASSPAEPSPMDTHHDRDREGVEDRQLHRGHQQQREPAAEGDEQDRLRRHRGRRDREPAVVQPQHQHAEAHEQPRDRAEDTGQH